MVKKLVLATLLVLGASNVFAQAVLAPTIQLRDEGVSVGSVNKLDCVGAGVTCTRTGQLGTITVSGGSGGGITLGTPQTASTTQVLFTGIPAGTKRVTITIVGLSTNGTSDYIVRFGTSGGLESTGYLGSGQSVAVVTNFTTGFPLCNNIDASRTFHGQGIATIQNTTTNLWVWSNLTGASNVAAVAWGGASKPLAGALTQLALTTVNGVDTFDAGTVNIAYE